MTLARLKHIQYVKNVDDATSRQSFEYWLSEHLRLNGMYWGVMALVGLKSLDTLPKPQVIEYVLSCYDAKSGGFGAYPQHDGHILSTLSGLQILLIYDSLHTIDDKRAQITKFIKDLQLPDGSFQGDSYGEVDTRFVYNAVSSLSILGQLTEDVVERASQFLVRCENFDGSYGMEPGAESHAAQVFTVVGALAIMDKLHLVKHDKLATWLSERQVKEGGFNGRPEKLPDSCYSWWVLSPLTILGHQNWVDLARLGDFILGCQDEEIGGFSDRKDNQTDIYHTCFAIMGLSLADHELYDLEAIDPVYCMPYSATQKIQKWPYAGRE
ncbi:Rab geranylgeranyltransferase [Yamadazyma tenuis]|uniref:Geranylgeranyl transferase type-2 subunit beta n=1 Tax=Candida tenuis (strain ATCC 10573 / BCRC 21748 / CBS 615 / JCM 9827 / NBRC 10315 / NRRL Y-1498 / VKM Y-70) TaxID=590646 RepID=G3B951_CANTC|nr:uncharacterized protein CANTEDRAFT_136403 [Yamadazyma tenuis ATCC 10573]EGV62463.1 hypothetical protein CANTEDRAFT_136403 [Yamadazyma tenuis ATCC 10573]WEJ93749.1 Rab geranylgeranyltransferase [Yamadazyma tenuis]